MPYLMLVHIGTRPIRLGRAYSYTRTHTHTHTHTHTYIPTYLRTGALSDVGTHRHPPNMASSRGRLVPAAIRQEKGPCCVFVFFF